MYLTRESLPVLTGNVQLDKTWIIDISFSKICHIEPNVFNTLSNLLLIDMNGNEIVSIDPFTFNDLKNLRYLNIGNNRLSQLTAKEFNELINLTHLILCRILFNRLRRHS